MEGLRLARRFRRLGPPSALWLGLVASFGAAAADQQIDPALNLYAKPQRLVQLQDGRRMNVLCEGSGVPTVILEAGAGGSTLDWRKVQSTLAQTTRVCSYDRAGMGFSDAGPLPRTADAVVTDLESLLRTTDAAQAPTIT